MSLGARFDRWPRIMPAPEIRILMYTDDWMGFDGGAWDGLTHLIHTLEARRDYWVKIKVTTAHREDKEWIRSDPLLHAEHRGKKISELNLSNYDELWLFGNGSAETNKLEEGEIKAIKDFMDAGGGVFATGDHDDLGAALSSKIPRVSKMRRWEAGKPPGLGRQRNTTLRPGYSSLREESENVPRKRGAPSPPDVGTTDSVLGEGVDTFPFDNQSDDIPQDIIVKRYPIASPYWWEAHSRPHPLLCSKEGVIDVLPDHMHEGEVVRPATLDPAEWPSTTVPGAAINELYEMRPGPEVIAWSTIVEPTAEKGRTFGAIGVYDGHIVDVGRIVTDSTFHHFVDINLIGDWGTPDDVNSRGFIDTKKNLDASLALRKIDAYFRNIAVWLAPPRIQTEMLHALVWSALHVDPLVKFDHSSPVYVLGEAAIDALGKYAPQCTIIQLLTIMLRPEMTTPWPWPPDFHDISKEPVGPIPWMLEKFLLGHILRNLRENFQAGIAQSASIPTHGQIDASFRGAVVPAIKDFVAFYSELATQAKTMAERFEKRPNEPYEVKKDKDQQKTGM